MQSNAKKFVNILFLQGKKPLNLLEMGVIFRMFLSLVIYPFHGS